MEPEDPPRRIYSTKPREFERENAPPGSAEGKSTEHDVYAMLQQNRAREKHAGFKEVELKPVRSRRKREYWLLLALGNALFNLVCWEGRNNVFVVVSAGAGIVVFSPGLTHLGHVVCDERLLGPATHLQ